MKKYDLEKKIRVGMYIIINKKCWQINRINVERNGFSNVI